MRARALILPIVALAACSEPTPEEAALRAAERCEERARDAQGPQVGLRIGANSETGPSFAGSIRITSDALRGREPLEVYEDCVLRLTGEPPVRPARL